MIENKEKNEKIAVRKRDKTGSREEVKKKGEEDAFSEKVNWEGDNENIYNRKKKIVLKEEWMVGFITTWIVGLLAHAYRFFNFLPIWGQYL